MNLCRFDYGYHSISAQWFFSLSFIWKHTTGKIRLDNNNKKTSMHEKKDICLGLNICFVLFIRGFEQSERKSVRTGCGFDVFWKENDTRQRGCWLF